MVVGEKATELSCLPLYIVVSPKVRYFPHSSIYFVADIRPSPPNINIFQKADDTAFHAFSKPIQHINRTMNEAIYTFSSWCNEWGLTSNSHKTQAIVFIPPKRRYGVKQNPNKLTVTISYTHIPYSKHVTYLGVNHKLTWRIYLQNVISKAYSILNLLRRLTDTTWGLKPHTVIK